MAELTATQADPSDPATVADELVRVVEAAADHLRAVPPTDAARPRGPGKWSKKEELGHLLDSAVNNHHRFVRAQEVDALAFPDYHQEFWVAAQRHQDSDWRELVELWRLYNRHLARVIAVVPAEKLGTVCTIGPYEPATFGFLIVDYLTHLRHHLRLMDVPC